MTGFESIAPVASKAVPSVLASSVCWSLQCLISALKQRGRWWTLYFRLICSVVLWGGRDAANKKHWRVLAVPQLHWACPCSQHVCPPCPHCSGSRLLHWEPSEAGPGLLAPPRSKPLSFRHSGSPQRRRLSWACVLCPSQVRAAQVMRCLASAIATTYRLPAARLSRCTTGAPSQADVDLPESQEVLVSNKACLQFGR